MDDIPNCRLCGEKFDNIFDATNHLVEDGGEEEFNPYMRLPNGYSLRIGALLRELYDAADKPDIIKHLTQMTYATLYAAETDISEMQRLVEESIIRSHMFDFDSQLKELLDGDKE